MHVHNANKLTILKFLPVQLKGSTLYLCYSDIADKLGLDGPKKAFANAVPVIILGQDHWPVIVTRKLGVWNGSVASKTTWLVRPW